MKIAKEIYRQITTQSFLKEVSGLLGGINGTILYYYQASSNNNKECSCYLEGERINKVIDLWQRKGIDFYGIYHTHPICDDRLSAQDISYITAVMNALSQNVECLYFPVILPNKKMTAYKAVNKGQISIVKETVIQIDL